MIAVSALTSYLYCPKKFYLQYALGMREPAAQPTAEGTILHDAMDRMQNGINDVTSQTNDSTTKSDLEIGYRKAYYLGLYNSINANEHNIKSLNIDKKELFKNLWAQLSEEASQKAEFVFTLITKHKIYGKGLLEKIKACTEVQLTSEALGLRGVADRIEESEGKVTVCEMKTGKAPAEGIWPNHKIQLAAYMMILKEKEQRPVEGILEYGQDKRRLILNPFIEDDVKSLIREVKTALETRKIPQM